MNLITLATVFLSSSTKSKRKPSTRESNAPRELDHVVSYGSRWPSRLDLYIPIGVIAVFILMTVVFLSRTERPAYTVTGTAVSFVTSTHHKSTKHVYINVLQSDNVTRRYDTGYQPSDCPLVRLNVPLRVKVSPIEIFLFGKTTQSVLLDNPCRK